MLGISPGALARIAIVYFALASLALCATRFDGGVAFLWFATPYLIAEMGVGRRRQWPAMLIVAAMASILATGLFGFGWGAALPMAIANLVETVIGSYLLRFHARQAPLDSLGWLARFALSVGTLAPLASGLIAAPVALALGKPAMCTLANWFAGHALSNFAFTPILLLIAQGELRTLGRGLRDRPVEGWTLMALSFATIVATFSQRQMPLLFLPVLPTILMTFRLGRGAAALSILSLALVGGIATLGGEGPIQLLAGTPGLRAQFFELYLAVTVLTVWPVAADLRNRSRLYAQLQDSEARYRLIAVHSSDILMKLSPDAIINMFPLRSPSLEATTPRLSSAAILGK